MFACCNGFEDVVQVLLEAGANPETHNESGHTPLMEAASDGKVGVARLLVKHGAQINSHSNEYKESALTLASYKGHLEMVSFLICEDNIKDMSALRFCSSLILSPSKKKNCICQAKSDADPSFRSGFYWKLALIKNTKPKRCTRL